ncbi:MAG: LysM domain, partial [Pseudomonadota bacterium]
APAVVQHPPGSLPDNGKKPVADPGVRAMTTYRPGGDPGGPGIPYQAPQLETVKKGGTLSVMPGDTITAIATRHKVSVSEIMRVNGLVTPVLQPGQRIQIPAR